MFALSHIFVPLYVFFLPLFFLAQYEKFVTVDFGRCRASFARANRCCRWGSVPRRVLLKYSARSAMTCISALAPARKYVLRSLSNVCCLCFVCSYRSVCFVSPTTLRFVFVWQVSTAHSLAPRSTPVVYGVPGYRPRVPHRVVRPARLRLQTAQIRL